MCTLILNDIALRYITNDNHKRLNSAFVLSSLQLSVYWHCRWTFYFLFFYHSPSVLLKLFLRTSIICNFLLKWHSIKQSKSISSGRWRIVRFYIILLKIKWKTASVNQDIQNEIIHFDIGTQKASCCWDFLGQFKVDTNEQKYNIPLLPLPLPFAFSSIFCCCFFFHALE